MHFSKSADLLIASFDQPTGRNGGLTSLFDCADVYSPTSAALLKATACTWSDATALSAYLTSASTVLPGDTLSLRDDVIMPEDWPAERGCTYGPCALNQAATISTAYPCDDARTGAVEACAAPRAVITGSPELSKCRAAAFHVDASESSGGGGRTLSHTWGVLPDVSDNAASISSYLVALDPATSAVTLGANLVGGGDSWTMTLTVTNYLDLSSSVATLQARRARPPAPPVELQLTCHRRPRPGESPDRGCADHHHRRLDHVTRHPGRCGVGAAAPRIEYECARCMHGC